MVDGNHEVRTAWGFLAVRLPLPEDPQWAADQTTILQALGVLDPDGNPTARLELVKAADVARLTQEDFDRERNKMITVCEQCHSGNFARAELAKADDLIRYYDPALPAEAAWKKMTATALFDGLGIRLFEMHLKHRMRAFQGAFHANPDYALWYGWSEMIRDLQHIREEAKELRRHAQHHPE